MKKDLDERLSDIRKSMAETLGLSIDKYIVDHGVSGMKEPEERELGRMMKKLRDGDTVIASELSRLGRSMLMVMKILEHCMKNGVKVITVKDNYELGDNIQSKVLAFAFSLAAEIERDMICRRTKEGLARRKAEGFLLGRPRGRNNTVTKLTGREEEIKILLEYKVKKSAIARKMSVCRMTLDRFLIHHNIAKNKKTTNVQSQLTIPGLISDEELLNKINTGQTFKDIAKSLGVTSPTIANYVNSKPKLIRQYQRAQDKIRIEKNGGLKISERHRGGLK
jgi:DNA invertase Pin-like site-specific DNA recombinase